ncbi:MAG: hypothetical protein A2664_01685 [Candidatus Taylorbacteria bacterium RIFCSPHIGHO2_01_FULL_46_22b]|uniref:Small ribosomal subunit protein uS5 n=1 Tax=Candidatus Taylorbacteria bacterium RIFCSPHIGHO2_01_FULL_46_22b TaxID=1802301 RepID=A0A1G2M5F1_9BACT|nr:MAG: hypothetical protein A2664_01685 [Candidatus Taylorbacteria bacterium RIFCSPHIGHO2_01_FULL_46_22b]
MQGTQQTATPAVAAPSSAQASPRQGDTRDRMPFRRKNVRRQGRDGKMRQEYDQKLLNIRRVARVSTGGRRFSFSVAMILGNRKGLVGVGTGKGTDTAIAIEKAMRSAKKNMVKILLTSSGSIPHYVEAKYSSARIMLIPARGRGVVAGGAVRNIIELAGIKDVTAKILSPSKNSLNNARATMLALSRLTNRGSGMSVKTVENKTEVTEK